MQQQTKVSRGPSTGENRLIQEARMKDQHYNKNPASYQKSKISPKQSMQTTSPSKDKMKRSEYGQQQRHEKPRSRPVSPKPDKSETNKPSRIMSEQVTPKGNISPDKPMRSESEKAKPEPEKQKTPEHSKPYDYSKMGDFGMMDLDKIDIPKKTESEQKSAGKVQSKPSDTNKSKFFMSFCRSGTV